MFPPYQPTLDKAIYICVFLAWSKVKTREAYLCHHVAKVPPGNWRILGAKKKNLVWTRPAHEVHRLKENKTSALFFPVPKSEEPVEIFWSAFVSLKNLNSSYNFCKFFELKFFPGRHCFFFPGGRPSILRPSVRWGASYGPILKKIRDSMSGFWKPHVKEFCEPGFSKTQAVLGDFHFHNFVG